MVSYTTVSPLPALAAPAVCFLWHCPAGHPGLPLTTTLPCGARTFLGDDPCRIVDAAVRSARPPRTDRTRLRLARIRSVSYASTSCLSPPEPSSTRSATRRDAAAREVPAATGRPAGEHRARHPPRRVHLPGRRGDDPLLPGASSASRSSSWSRTATTPGRATSSSTSATATCSASSTSRATTTRRYEETIGALQHMAISVSAEQFEAAKAQARRGRHRVPRPGPRRRRQPVLPRPERDGHRALPRGARATSRAPSCS